MYNSKINRGVKKLKFISNDLAYSLCLSKIRKASSGRRIIVYHGVTQNAKTDINARFISTQRFDKEIEFYKNNFNVVSLKEFTEGANHPNKLTVAITFDDGYLNNYKEALPILEKHQVQATFFITTIEKAGYQILWADALDLHRYTSTEPLTFKAETYKKRKNEFYANDKSLKHFLKTTDWSTKQTLVEQILSKNQFIDNPDFSPYHRLMNQEEILNLSKSKYACIGSHGLYHNCLTHIPLNDAKHELQTSKSFLENVIQQEVTDFAYPDGDYNIDLIEAAKDIGYKTQLIVDFNRNTAKKPQGVYPRFGINPYISFNNQMNCIINGKY